MNEQDQKAEDVRHVPPRVTQAGDPAWVRWSLTLLALFIMTVLVIIPVIAVFYQALLTLIVAPCAVAMNLVFGIAAAWAIARFRFRGRTLLITLIDIPFSISPVVVGLMFVLLFGMGGFFGPWLRHHGAQILFATPGLILATTFVTLPFVARELIPLMEAIGPDEELAALSLGASGRQIFWRITLPNIRWGVLYGVILCNARAMGEFGAVYVVSGHIAGETNTMPLQIEQLFQGFNSTGAFAVASVLTLLAAVTLLLKVIVEQKARQTIKAAHERLQELGS
jgi:sulfate/thiosulfate transport system permease protein